MITWVMLFECLVFNVLTLLLAYNRIILVSEPKAELLLQFIIKKYKKAINSQPYSIVLKLTYKEPEKVNNLW